MGGLGRATCTIHSRDVSAGATGATAPEFSDTLTLSQPGGGQILPTIAEVEPKFPRDYVPALNFCPEQTSQKGIECTKAKE